MKIWLDGKLVDEKEAVVSVFDHGLLYGDGVFESMRAYGGKIFKMAEHLQRLFESAKIIKLKLAFGPRQIEQAVRETCAANNVKDGYIRVTATRGPGDLGLDPLKCSDRGVLFILAASIQLYPQELYEKGLSIITGSTIRNHPNALPARVKSLNYLNNILAKLEGHASGAAEVLMLNHEGYVAECTGDNIFLVKDGRLKTPPPEAGILLGVTRQTIIDLAREAGYAVQEANIVRAELFVADEVFLTGTAAEVVPVVEIDQRTIGEGKPGPVTRELVARFRRLVGKGEG